MNLKQLPEWFGIDQSRRSAVGAENASLRQIDPASAIHGCQPLARCHGSIDDLSAAGIGRTDSLPADERSASQQVGPGTCEVVAPAMAIDARRAPHFSDYIHDGFRQQAALLEVEKQGRTSLIKLWANDRGVIGKCRRQIGARGMHVPTDSAEQRAELVDGYRANAMFNEPSREQAMTAESMIAIKLPDSRRLSGQVQRAD